MRNIKFRGRETCSGLWRYGSLLVDDGKCYIIQSIQGALVKWSVDQDSVGQFTGLTDKNGFDIYEGDIIRLKEPHGMYSEAELSFFEKGYWAINHGINDRVIAGFVDKKQIEIIGNIYDNHELTNNKRL